MRFMRAFLVSVLLFAVGCATPPEVKQALVSLDRSYAENAKVMRQYGELVGTVSDRFDQLNRYVQYRAGLDLALLWATTNPPGKREAGVDPAAADAAYAGASAAVLGKEVLAVVNEIRLAGLPGRRGDDPAGGAVFTQGSADMDQLVRRLPRLVNAVAASVDRAAHAAPRERAAFDAYAKNVEALRQINATVKRYLDIDVTVAPQDVREIADAIREIQR